MTLPVSPEILLAMLRQERLQHLAARAVIGDDEPGGPLRPRGHPDHLGARGGQPDLRRLQAEVVNRPDRHRLLLGGHDALERWVASFAGLVGDRNDNLASGFDRLGSGVAVATDAHGVTVDGHFARVGHGRKSEAFGYELADLQWLTINAMKSAFLPFDQRLRIISEVIKPGYSSMALETLIRA